MAMMSQEELRQFTMTDLQKRLEDLMIDMPFSSTRAAALFKRAMPIDSAIYASESKPYRADAGEYNPKEEKPYREAPDARDELNAEYGKIINFPSQGQVSSASAQQNSAGKTYAQGSVFEKVALQYLQTHGQTLINHLKKQGRSFYNLTRIGNAGLEQAIAGVVIHGEEAALIGDKNFEEKVKQLARSYGVDREIAERYVLDHETTHLSQKGKYAGDTIAAELDVEQTLVSFYKTMGKQDPTNSAKYEALESIASDRSNNVFRNYSGNKYAGKGEYKAPAGVGKGELGKGGIGSLSSYAGKGAYAGSGCGAVSSGAKAA